MAPTFFTLPAELRLHIYELLLVNHPITHPNESNQTTCALELLHTCSTMRHEGLPLYLKHLRLEMKRVRESGNVARTVQGAEGYTAAGRRLRSSRLRFSSRSGCI